MKAIYKYPMPHADECEIEMPQAAQPLSVGLDANGDPSMWVLVNPSAPRVPVRFAIVGTGDPPQPLDASDFVGTIVSGAYVRHVFRVRSEPALAEIEAALKAGDEAEARRLAEREARTYLPEATGVDPLWLLTGKSSNQR